MKTIAIKYTLALACLAFSLPALSAPFWKFTLEVAYMISDTSGNVQVMFFENDAPLKACGDADPVYHEFSLDAVGGASMNSYLLAAFAANRKVSVIIDCDNTQLHAVRIDKP